MLVHDRPRVRRTLTRDRSAGRGSRLFVAFLAGFGVSYLLTAFSVAAIGATHHIPHPPLWALLPGTVGGFVLAWLFARD